MSSIHSNGTSNTSITVTGEPRPYVVNVSRRFIYGTLLTSVLLAFAVGRTARVVLIDGPLQQLLANHAIAIDIAMIGSSTRSPVLPDAVAPRGKGLPNPKLIQGKEVPRTLYTAKNFDTAIGSSSASMYLERDASVTVTGQPVTPPVTGSTPDESASFCEKDANGEKQCSRGKSMEIKNTTDEEEEHLPAGQHLLVDIKNVDSAFLNSEISLAEAMLSVVNQSKLTLLSYHCHKLVPMGVSCVGVLLESHISFHTWPKEGVITLDLFTCGSGELMPVLPILESLFAVPQMDIDAIGASSVNDLPEIHWSHKLRGFGVTSPLGDDLGKMVLESTHHDMKKEVASTKTIFQRIDIFDTINAQEKEISSYIKSQSNDGSYESLHPEYFLPEREIFLDGVLQSTRLGNEPYHEALVHPAMLAHPNPKRVGIIGGGEGATLREVLKHNTLEKVKMIEIDEAMVYFCKEHLPDWNSCADLEGSAEWCGDDARAEMYYEDGLAWFNNRFSEDGKIDSEEFREEPFDILIMDALDPQDNVPFADMLYTNKAFIKTLYNALSEDGIIIMQLGESPNFSDPAEELSRNSKRDFVMNVLEEVGFNHVHVYQEGHCKFRAPWSFAAAMKGKTGDASWQKTTAEIDVSIHKRILRTVSGEPAVKSFDGSLMAGFQIPAKSFETVYCRSIPTPENCGSAHGASLEEGRRLYDPLADRMGSSIGPKDLLASFQKKAY